MVQTVESTSRVVRDPKIMLGKPTIRGTRITVEHILRMLAAGWTIDDIVAEHPRLTKEDVLAASAYAADHLRDAFPGTMDAAE
jgi:uncharacterized protein (DUF433 family)